MLTLTRCQLSASTLALLNENVERVHDLFNGGGVVPALHVENVDLGRAQLFERGFHGDVKGLGAVPRIVHHVALLTTLVISRILSRVSRRNQAPWLR